MRTAAKGRKVVGTGSQTDGSEVPVSRRIGAVDVAALDRDAALALVLRAVERSEPAIFGFCNAHTVNVARRRADFAAAMAQATVFPDGIGVDIASKLIYGAPFPANLNGTDFTPAVLGALPAGTRVFLLGSPPGVAEQAARAILARFPGIVIAGIAHGYFDAGESAALAARIRASEAQLLLLGMGHPRQELWAAEWVQAAGTVALCVGAYLDFAADRVPRAPAWIRNVRFEWAYRLAIEPRRLAGRYLWGNIAFLAAAARQRMRAPAP